MKILIFISLFIQFVTNHEHFNVPKAGVFFSDELNKQPSAVGTLFGMPKFKDLTGKRFNRLLVLSYSHSNHRDTFYLCKCDCGVEKHIRGGCLTRGQKSCGCYSKDHPSSRKHGHSSTKNGISPEYVSWYGMKSRCYIKNQRSYKDYGGRGIRVCKRWLGENGFINFLADMGKKPSPKHTIDRKNVNLNYTPSNCRWATPKEQSDNTTKTIRITFKGKTKTLVEWSAYLNINRRALYARVKRGGLKNFDQPLNFRKNITKLNH